MGIELGFTEAIDRPARCAKCPMLREIAKDYDKYSAVADGMIQALMDGSDRDYFTEGMIDAGIDPEIAEAFWRENSDKVRQSGKNIVEHADEARDKVAGVGRRAVAACGGSLSMRAQKSGTEVKVTVCMSGVIDDINQHALFEATTVERRVIGDK